MRNRLAVSTKLYVQVECSTQHEALLCVGFITASRTARLPETSHAQCFGSTLFSPARAAQALGGLPGDGLAAGAGRVHPSPGQAGAENAPGQIPITSMRPARLKARASHYWRNGFGGASAISAMPTMINAGTSPSRCPCSPAFDNACTVMMPA